MLSPYANCYICRQDVNSEIYEHSSASGCSPFPLSGLRPWNPLGNLSRLILSLRVDLPMSSTWTVLLHACTLTSVRHFQSPCYAVLNARQFLPERHYVTFGSLLSQIRLSVVCLPVCLSVTLLHPAQRVEAFGNLSSPLCTLAIMWPPYKILRRSSQGTPPSTGVKRKRGVKIERFWTYRRLYLINGTR